MAKKRKEIVQAAVQLDDEQAWEMMSDSVVQARVLMPCPNGRFWKIRLVGAIAGGEYDFCGFVRAAPRDLKNFYKNKFVAVEPVGEFPHFIYRPDKDIEPQQ